MYSATVFAGHSVCRIQCLLDTAPSFEFTLKSILRQRLPDTVIAGNSVCRMQLLAFTLCFAHSFQGCTSLCRPHAPFGHHSLQFRLEVLRSGFSAQHSNKIVLAHSTAFQTEHTQGHTCIRYEHAQGYTCIRYEHAAVCCTNGLANPRHPMHDNQNKTVLAPFVLTSPQTHAHRSPCLHLLSSLHPKHTPLSPCLHLLSSPHPTHTPRSP